jgi:thioredoxin-dependent peroxiredoxin
MSMSDEQPMRVGEPAPDFSLPATTGGTVSLADFRGRQAVVLYFYPKDDTPGCTREACYFRDLSAEFEQKGAVILGISTDSLRSHEKFRTKHGLPFPLLSDEDAAVATRYGVWKEKSMHGRKFLGIERTTFVIDKDGRVRSVFPKVSVEGHADEVLAALD